MTDNKTKTDPKKRAGEVTHHIRAWRKSKGWTIHELAKESGLGPSLISQIEHGRSRYSQQSLEKIAAAFDVTPGTILDRPPEAGTSVVASLAAQKLSKEDCCDVLVEVALRLVELRSCKDQAIGM